MRLRRRTTAPGIEVGAGEKVLAWTTDAEGAVLAGTRDACYLPAPDLTRIPWEQVEAAEWDVETETFRLSEVGAWGEQRPEHEFRITDPGTFLELVRERVTASIVLVRHVKVTRTRGLRVVGRRAPRGRGPIRWFYEYDADIDASDPEVRRAAEHALASAREEVGDPGPAPA